jgi:Cu-processing system permease protein
MKQLLNTVLIQASKEISDAVRNRWVAMAILLLGSLALALSFLGTVPVGETRVSGLDVGVVNLASLSMYLIPLIALMLSFDALVGEFENGTMLLLLTYPVTRWQILFGKFLGHVAILLLAILIGYGSTFAMLVYAAGGETEGWQAYAGMMLSSLLLGCVFLALGYLISSVVRERALGIGIAIFTWIMLVVCYDLGLLSLLTYQDGELISQEMFSVLILINPADAYRLFNYIGFEEVGRLVGAAGITADFTFSVFAPLMSMTLWMVIPLLMATIRFQRTEL